MSAASLGHITIWLAGTLYQSSKYGGAARFLKEGCSLGARALHMRAGLIQDDTEDGEQAEGWKQLEEQMFRRWELLAVCYSKIGDRKVIILHCLPIRCRTLIFMGTISLRVTPLWRA